MSAYEKLAGLIVERGAVPIVGRLETAGWWLAPVQLTPEMRTAGQDAGGFDGYRQEDNTDDIWTALRTTAPSLPVDAGEGRVPDGWKLVPEEPDNEMRAAAHQVFIDEGMILDERCDSELNIYAAMLAAAPQPPGVSPAPDALAEIERLKAELREARVNADQFGSLWASSIQELNEQEDRHKAAIAQAETGEAGASEPSLREALERLSKQVGKLTLFESELRAELGNTAWRDLTMALSHANAALVAPSPEPSRHGVEAMRDVAAERERQRSVEGWTSEHDDEHGKGEMAWAAACYALAHQKHNPPKACWPGDEMASAAWPWEFKWWKPTTPRRNLIKAGALILAEIERLDRTEQRSQDVGGGCTAGVGCDEYGGCYADAHGEPEKCPRTATLAQHQGGGQTSGGRVMGERVKLTEGETVLLRELCFETPVSGCRLWKKTALAGLQHKRLANGFGHVTPAGRAALTETAAREALAGETE